jgi:hypothetical protein
MSNKASIACAGALIAAVTLASTGPALFVLPAAAEDSRYHSRARRRRQAGGKKKPTRSTMKCKRP